jgi:hypothetical protein
MGYRLKFETKKLEGYDAALIFTGIWFVLNLINFAAFGLVYFHDPVIMMLVETNLFDMLVPTTCFNFYFLGNLVAEMRGVS